MSTYSKFIYWRPDLESQTGGGGKMWANVHIIPNNYDRSLEGYRKLVLELQKTFPQALPSRVECLVVTNSGWCKSCPVILFSAAIVKKEYDGYHSREGNPDYSYS